MEKDFTNWNELKIKLDQKQGTPTFKQREIWWCHIGLNIGDEENGKSANYHRPILIIKKFNKKIFLAVPLTTQIKDNPYYHKISFQSKTQCAMLSQIRILDAKRLDRKMGKLTSEEFEKLKEDIFGKILVGKS
jgi:mRNA-degrading endonuclease toxin of MazEF toxin-antitoxin module